MPPVIRDLPNTTKPFDPNDYMMKLQGKEYLPVAARIAWVNAEFGHEFSVSSELVEHNSYPGKNPRNAKEEITVREALFKVRVTFPNGKFKEAWGSETNVDFKDYLEKAETKALGRALGFAGYGTLFAPEFDESATISRGESRDKAQDNTYENTRAVDTAQDLDMVRDRITSRKKSSSLGGEESSSQEEPLATTQTSGTTPTKTASKEHDQLVQSLLAEVKKSKSNPDLEKQINELISEANSKGKVKRASQLPTDELRDLVQTVQEIASTHA